MAKMSVDDKLGLDLFHTDEHNPHITVNAAKFFLPALPAFITMRTAR